MMSRRFILTILTLVVIIAIAGFAVFLAKGYRISPKTGSITGTGIISVTSVPDQASVYLDGHLTTATDDTINSLTPKTYRVKIEKEGYIVWEKDVEVKEGLVTEITATLFRRIPTVYPLTYSGVDYALVSPDNAKLMYIVPIDPSNADTLSIRRSGVWVWPMATQGIGIGRGSDPRQVALTGNLDFTQAKFRWSPDSTQIFVDFPNQKLLLETDRLNDPPRDITANYQATIRSWDQTESENRQAKIELIQDTNLKKIASNSANLKWSPDDTKIVYSEAADQFRVADLVLQKTYSLPKAKNYVWHPDSEHLIMIEPDPQPKADRPLDEALKEDPEAEIVKSIKSKFLNTKVSVVEVDGLNKSEIYYGGLDPDTVFTWPDGSRIVIISSLATAPASQPNLYGINLK